MQMRNTLEKHHPISPRRLPDIWRTTPRSSVPSDSAGTIDLVEHLQAGNCDLQAEVARLQRQAETSTASRSPRLQHPQEGGGGNSTGLPGSPSRYINLAQQQRGQIVDPPQQQPPNNLLGAEGAKDAQTAGLMELISNLQSRLASVEKGAASVFAEDPLARSSLHCSSDEHSRPLFDWAMTSRATELFSQRTAVNIGRCFNLQPLLIDKEQARHFWRTLSGDQLLRAFHDLLSHLEDTKTRVQLTSKLYMFACAVNPDYHGKLRTVVLGLDERANRDSCALCGPGEHGYAQ